MEQETLFQSSDNEVGNEDQLDELDLEDLPETEDVDTFRGVSLEIQGKHWLPDREALLKVLDIVQAIPAEQYPIFCMGWGCEGGDNYIRVYVSNMDYVFSAKVPIRNSESTVFNETKLFFFQSKNLYILAKAFSQFAFVFEGDSIQFYSPNMKYTFKTYTYDFNDIKLVAPKEEGREFPLSVSDIGSINKMFGFVIRLIDNKINLKGDEAEGFFTLYSFDFKMKESVVTPHILRKLDVALLELIYKFQKSFKYVIQGERIYYLWDGGFFSFYIRTDVKDFPKLLSGEEIGSIRVELSAFGKSLSVAYSLGENSLLFYEEGGIIYAKGVKGVRFKVGIGTLGMDVELPLDELKKLLNAIVGGEESILIQFLEDGIRVPIVIDDMEHSYCLAKMTTGKIKRDEKIAIKEQARIDRTDELDRRGEKTDRIQVGEDSNLAEILSERDEG